MFKKMFKNKIEVFAPLCGELSSLANVNDPVFSQKMMGEGVAIKPTSNTILSPFDGTVIQLFDTNHAIGLSDYKGNEILIHIGLDTVNLKGKGFTAQVKKDDKVKKGQPLIILDLDYLNETKKDLITPVVNTNNKKIRITNKQLVTAGETILMTIEK